MRSWTSIHGVILALACLTIAAGTAEGETFTGVASASGTYKRPLFIADGKRYELKASDKAAANVAEMLAKFSKGNRGTYVVKGTRGTVNGMNGIIIDAITPAAKPLPSARAAAPGTNAVQGNAPPASAQTNPTVTSRVVTVNNRQYTTYDYDDPAPKQFRLVIPNDLKTVRGLLVISNHNGGDSRDYWTDCTYYREFMHLHGFAFIGDTISPSHVQTYQGMLRAIQQVSIASRHPELVNAPYVATGFSAGGGFASTLMTYAPNRTIAAGIYGARYNFDVFTRPGGPTGPTAAHLAIPSILITGEREKLNDCPADGRHKVDEVFVPYRPKGAQLAWIERQGIGHAYDENRQDVMAMPLLDAAVRARYPKDGDVTKGPIKLLPIDPATGWIADNTTWKSGLTRIYPPKQFKGDLSHSSWLQNEDLAFIYRAYSTYDKPLTITAPGNCWPTVPALDPGASVPIIVDASKFPNWKTMAFYDGAKKLAEIARGPTRFTAKNLTPGYHVFSVLATDSNGNVRTADPKMVVVREPAAAPVPKARAGGFNVKDFGAKGNGVADDTPAIQSAINAAAESAGGGTVIFPKGTYLLNSAYPSSHPWGFHNLLIRSNVTLLGETGSKLLQGPKGRHPLPEGAEAVRNTVLAFGADHEVIRFQNRAYNGGFFSLRATRASSTKVVLKTASESSKFLPGDYMAIYQTTSGDVIPTETGRITTVNASTGELGLKEPLSRSFKTPSIANVTKIATTNVGVKNLIVQGSEPLTVTEVFGFTAEDCRFVNDTSIGGKNVIDYNMNTLNGFRFVRCVFTAVGPGYAVMEWTQRNSRHGVWEGNTFEIVQGGMGEYAADIRFTNNTFRLHPNARTSVGLMIGGIDIVFRGNTVTAGKITGGQGWGCVLCDCVGPGYHRYVGNIEIADNTFTYQGNGNQCVHLVAHDTSFTGNTVIVKGSAMGVRAEGPPPQTLTIKNNKLSMGTGTGIYIASSRVDGSTVTGNTISGSGAHGIYVESPAKPNAGKHVIHGNTVAGYRKALFIDRALHPGTVLSGKAGHAVPARGAGIAVVAAFPGNKGPGWKSSIDVAGAVGPKHVVCFDVGGFVVRDKATGKQLKRLSPREFWHWVEPAKSLDPQKNANDPRIIYDPLSERWFACAAGTTVPHCFLAVSTSSDPTRPWKGTKLPLPKINPYMKMGVDRNGLYITSCNGNHDWRKGTHCYVIPKRDAIAPGGPVLTRGQAFTELHFGAMPAMDLAPDKAADAPQVLLTNEFSDGTCGEVYLYRITWSGSKASISDVQIVQLRKTYQTPNNTTKLMEAVQPAPGPNFRAGGGGRRLDSVFVHKGSVFGCNGAKRTLNSRLGILWYQVRIRDGALLQEGLVDDPNCDYIFPSVAVDGKGNVGLGCTRTSKTEFPSVYVMMHAATDPPGTMRGPVLAVRGTTPYKYSGASAVNLSHYSSTCIDPSNPDLLWTYQAYANSTVDRQWCTAWAAFRLPAATTRPASRATSAAGPAFHAKDGQSKVSPRTAGRSLSGTGSP